MFGVILGSALKCYATWVDEELGKKGHDLIDCPDVPKDGGQTEKPNSCGKMTDAGGINLYCGYESLLKQHGVPAGEGCAEDVYSADGSPINMEICYCVNDGCNKNCTCKQTMEETDTGPKPISEPQTDSATTDKSSAFSRTTQSGSSSSIEASGLLVVLIDCAMFIMFSISA